MKNIICLLFIAVWLTGCTEDDKIAHIKPEKSGYIDESFRVTDSDGNVYRVVRYNGLDWLASNFTGGEPYYNAEDEWGDELIDFNNKTQAMEDYKIYGNLYTYNEAVNNAAMLGEGWRLPTDDDWQKLEEALGMSAGEAASTGWRGAPAGELIRQDSCGSSMNFLLGGYVNMVVRVGMRDLELDRMREFGYYWSSTEAESDYKNEKVVYYRSIRYNSSEIEREATIIGEVDNFDDFYPKYMSVRYVRNAKD